MILRLAVGTATGIRNSWPVKATRDGRASRGGIK